MALLNETRELLGIRPEDAADLPRLFEEFSRTTAELVASHEELQARVAALKRELAAKSRRLERKKRLEALGRVAAGVAHEFRNPLGGIRLTVDSLLRDREEGRARDRLEHIRRAVHHLDRIVEDLLTFTRPGEMMRTPVRVSDLIEAAVEIAFPDPEQVAFELIRAGDPDLEIYADRHAFIQILANLLVNASQAVAGRDGSHVGIWWGRRGENDWLEVADDGPGIPAGEEERIFFPFHTLREGGTGLGLAIVQARVEGQDGEIGVARDAWGGGADWGGARFRIVLPRPDEAEGRNEEES